jgi:hypothetical protein
MSETEEVEEVKEISSDIENQLNFVKHTPTFHEESDWTDQIENLLNKWKSQVNKLSQIHQESGYVVKTRFYRMSIPSIVIPFLMTFLSQNIDENSQTMKLINGAMFMMTSSLSALVMFFNYGTLFEQHFQYASRYSDIVTRIDSELARRRKFRTPSDVFVTEIKDRIENLNDGSPTIPGQWC